MSKTRNRILSGLLGVALVAGSVAVATPAAASQYRNWAYTNFSYAQCQTATNNQLSVIQRHGWTYRITERCKAFRVSGNRITYTSNIGYWVG